MTTVHSQIEQLAQQRILVVGLGASGRSVIQFLVKQGVAGQKLLVADSRQNPPACELPNEATVHVGSLPADLLDGIDLVIVSPGVDLRQSLFIDAERLQIPVIGDIELFGYFVKAPVMAVTGSNGKSTTVTLLHEMALACGLNAKLGGNIGTPALNLLPEVGQSDADVYILELSSFQLESTHNLSLAAAAVLNISPDHLDRYDSLAGYAAAKAKIFTHAQVAVINADDECVRDMPLANVESSACVGFTQQAPNGAMYGLLKSENRNWLAKRMSAVDSDQSSQTGLASKVSQASQHLSDEKLIAADELKVAGLPNQLNVLAAIAMADAMQWPRANVLAAASQFTGLPHRMQWVATQDNVRYYNDSKGTNVGATLAAILGLQEPVVLIAGGQSKGGEFAPLRSVLAERGRAVVLIGEDAEQIASELDGSVPVYFADSMQAAAQQAKGLAHAGDAVVLSPACASFDMFDGFEHRGDVFVAAVNALHGEVVNG